MSFFRRRKKHSVSVTHISPQVLIRKIIYDSGCPNPEEVAQVLGLTPISDEVADMEEQASADRLSKIEILMPIIRAHADISAQVAAVSYASELDSSEISDDMKHALVILFKFVAFSSAMTCLASLVDLDILTERN